MSDDYQMRISKLLIEAEPELLRCDPSATGRACFALANVMGSLLAAVLAKKGEATYRETMKMMFVKVDESARKVHERAQQISDNEDPSRRH